MVQEQTSTANAENVIFEIVATISEAEDVDPLELTPPLFEVINPDILGRIFATTPTGGRMEEQVTFSYNGYEVTVRADNVVEVVSE